MAAAAAAAASATPGGADTPGAAGRVIGQCVGTPPPYRLDRASNPYDALTVDDSRTEVFEDTGVGTTIRLACPTSCRTLAGTVGGASVRGSPDFYSDDSAVCMAAVHAGVLSADTRASPLPPAASSTWSSSTSAADEIYSDEKIVVVIARLLSGTSISSASARLGSEANNVTTDDVAEDWTRGFALEAALPSEVSFSWPCWEELPRTILGFGREVPSRGKPISSVFFLMMVEHQSTA